MCTRKIGLKVRDWRVLSRPDAGWDDYGCDIVPSYQANVRSGAGGKHQTKNKVTEIMAGEGPRLKV